MKIRSLLFSFILALSLIFSGFPVLADGTVSEDFERPEAAGSQKINPELNLRITVKQSLQNRSNPPAAGFEDTYPSFSDPQELASEMVCIYLDDRPTESQLEELRTLGVTPYPETWVPPVGQHPQGFFLADMPVDRLNDLSSKQFVSRLDTAERQMYPQNDIAGGMMNTPSAWSSGYNGTGVTMAVIDSSLDFNYLNPDDRHPDIPETAIVKDYSSYPSLDDDVRGYVSGHGTHVTASALGRGTGNVTYMGSAPGADLVFLKIGKDDTSGASAAAMIAAIMAAVDTYHADIINISYGSWSLFHDGSDARCQAVDYAVSRGATVFAAAGNQGGSVFHTSGNVLEQNYCTNWFYLDEEYPLSFSLVWHDPAGTNQDLFFGIWDDSISDYIHPMALSAYCGSSPRGTHGLMVQTYLGEWYALHPGWYVVVVYNQTDLPKDYHIYSNLSGIPGAFEYPDPNYTLDAPAEADSAIAVGAYVSRYTWTDKTGASHSYSDWLSLNTVASFSSRGPRVDAASGTMQIPSIVAPGAGIVSARDGLATDTNNPAKTSNMIDTAGNYFLMQGTSMASPLAAGVGAILKQKNPMWTPAQIRHALETTADRYGVPGDSDMKGWGMVKANTAVAVEMPDWLSYRDAGCTIPDADFIVPGDVAANMKGSGFLPGFQYGVAFYDGDGNLADSHLATTTQSGVLTASYTYTGSEASGLWHSIVFQNHASGSYIIIDEGTGGSYVEYETWMEPPDILTEGWPYLITSGEFTVSGPPDTVTLKEITGVMAPQAGQIPVIAVTPTDQYTGTVFWTPSDSVFQPQTVYTASIQLVAKPGYTMQGVTANYFTVPGAAATNPINSGVVTAVFPRTGYDPGLGVISGKVTDNSTGNPLAGITVWALNDATYQLEEAGVTDADGNYFIQVPDGVYAVRVQPDVYPMTYYKELVTVSDCSIVTDVNFSLKPGATITGTVTDADTGAGIEGVQVHAYDYEIDWGVPPVMTGINGTYNIVVSEGTYRIWAQPAPEYASQYYDCTDYENATPVSLTSGETKTDIDFALELLRIFITGETRSADGVILAGATVTLEGQPPVTSDAQGIYRIEVTSPGTYTVTASMAGYRNLSLEVTVVDLNEDVQLDFRGNTGLIPDAPDLSYVLACINRWQFPPDGITGLGMDKVLAVINAWKIPQ